MAKHQRPVGVDLIVTAAAVLIILSSSTYALSTATPPRDPLPRGVDASRPSSRRDFGAAITSSMTSAAVTAAAASSSFPLPANALKERNEALCGTGFFVNIAQYKCTDIGDISYEGQSRDMSKGERDATDSLLSKLDLNLGDEGGGDDSAATAGKKGQSSSLPDETRPTE